MNNPDFLDKRLRLPTDPAFGRFFPKNKVYDKAALTSRQKELFVTQVKKITHTSIIAPQKVNIPAKNGYNEIHVLTIETRVAQFNADILKIINKIIPYPIIFILQYMQKMCYIAAYKRLNQADKNKWVISEYFRTSWIDINADELPLPVALDLQSLYEQLILKFIPYRIRTNEKLDDLILRVEEITILEREALKIESRIKSEKQFNRKVELNSELKILKQKIDVLKA